MRVMYVAPRYHTNQIPIMKGWMKAGDEVCFVSQYCGGTEDYSVLKPEILGYSAFFGALFSVYRGFKKLTGSYVENDFNFQAKFGLLPKNKFKLLLDQKKPELVILRDRSLYNIAVTSLCKKRRIPCILYTQSPYMEEAVKKEDPVRRYFRKHTPAVRITPVWGPTEGRRTEENSWYVPFVTEPCCSPEEKFHFRDGQVQLLGIGKYETRKHHEMLLRLANECREEGVHVTIAGEAVTQRQKSCLEDLKGYVEKHHLEEIVTLKTNLTIEQVYEEYKKADLFLLPSTGEFASVSQLEAMSCSLPVICSDTNGTACYVEHGGNGFLFHDNDYEDFKQYTVPLIRDRDKLAAMGERSWNLVREKYLFANYRDKILTALKAAQNPVTVIFDCPVKQCDKLWVREELNRQGFRVKTVAPCLKLSQIEQRGKAGRLLFYLLTFWQCMKALFRSRKGETVVCWSQWSGLFFNRLAGAGRRNIISFNWLTPSSGKRTRFLYVSALNNPAFTAIINSGDTRERLRQAYGAGERERIVYIPDVYDDGEPFWFPIYRKENRYCFMGGRANRDWELLWKLAESCPDISFVAVAAKADWQERKELPNIDLKFDLPAKEYYRLLQESYLPVFLLKDEKVSGLINIVKSVQFGKPVLATDLPAVSMYYPKTCRTSLVPAGELEYLKERLYGIYGYTKQEYEEHVRLMEEHIKNKFSPQMAGKRLAGLIQGEKDTEEKFGEAAE